MNDSVPAADDHDIAAALVAMGLLAAGETVTLTALGGGVSCDVWRADLPRGPVCVKRALPRLRVEAEWHAPAERASSEVAWLRLVAGIEPALVPRVLAEDQSRHLFVMEYLAPETHPVWKAELARGAVDAAFAARVGAALARIHAATANNSDIAARFAHAAQFHALRIEPYLLTAAARNPAVGDRIRDIAGGIERARIALMHGDVSPKNILCGPGGPVFLDAETTSYGDPAFDLAFCLNHLLLKCVWHPRWTQRYLDSFSALASAYLAGADWEESSALERRAARILPALLLARVDGKSPVEYLTAARDRELVREHAHAWLRNAPSTLEAIRSTWTRMMPA
jgi:aminoglycoside phosphotransferase (APT) family kinase protein